VIVLQVERGARLEETEVMSGEEGDWLQAGRRVCVLVLMMMWSESEMMSSMSVPLVSVWEECQVVE